MIRSNKGGKKDMCSTPNIPSANTVTPEAIPAPTLADASVQKAGANTREQTAALAGRNVKTTALGLSDDATTQKKTILGG